MQWNSEVFDSSPVLQIENVGKEKFIKWECFIKSKWYIHHCWF